MKHFLPILLSLFVLITISSYAQDSRRSYVTVKGKVTDNDKNEIKNAMIFVDMIKTDVKSNKKGDYKIKIAPKEELLTVYHPRYGFINWKYNGEKKVNFLYPDHADVLSQEEMEELGFNFKVIEKDWYSGFNSVLDILQSKFTNVRVDANDNIIIGRMGSHVVSGDSRPLVLVNDIPTDVSQIDLIPTTEIKSIQVLHKADQTAAYGFRGVNGVIIIKLKTGESDMKAN